MHIAKGSMVETITATYWKHSSPGRARVERGARGRVIDVIHKDMGLVVVKVRFTEHRTPGAKDVDLVLAPSMLRVIPSPCGTLR
jgi:hypothetical protein